MAILWITLILVGPLIVAAAVIDLRARRRGVRYTVDGETGRDARRTAQAEQNMRTHGQGQWGGGTGQF